MNATRYLWEDYYIPSTRTLRNLLGGNDNPDGMLDPVELERIELELVAIRMAELAKAPIVGKFDLTHMKAIHRHLFQDVYEWAGEIRTAPADDAPPMNKDGVAYGPIGRITKIWSAEHSRIKKQDLLHGRDSASEFSEGLARFWGASRRAIRSTLHGSHLSTLSRFARPSSMRGITSNSVVMHCPWLRRSRRCWYQLMNSSETRRAQL